MQCFFVTPCGSPTHTPFEWQLGIVGTGRQYAVDHWIVLIDLALVPIVELEVDDKPGND
jgi:hypothetical protein